MGPSTYPAQFVSIQTYIACIGHGSLAKIELSIWPESYHICMVIAWPGQIVQDNGLSPVQVEATDTARTSRMASFGEVEAPLIKGETVDWLSQVLCQQGTLTILPNFPYTTAWPRSAKGQTCLGDIRRTCLNESQTRRKGKTICHQFEMTTNFFRIHENSFIK